MAVADEAPRFLPGRHLVDAYGNGGFRFADMGHRGSLLALPSGFHAWPVSKVGELTDAAIAPIVAEAGEIDLFVFGTGARPVAAPDWLRWRLRELRIGLDVMATSAAVRTYNILQGERRRAAAGFIAV